MEVIFEPGCFDDFDGTQEELDTLQAEIIRLAKLGKFDDTAEYDGLSDLSVGIDRAISSRVLH